RNRDRENAAFSGVEGAAPFLVAIREGWQRCVWRGKGGHALLERLLCEGHVTDRVARAAHVGHPRGRRRWHAHPTRHRRARAAWARAAAPALPGRPAARA